ncbi:hypothetical protein SADUNF_Sadunf05G0038200 [Salix dunnii]|uniref:Uncharacterized protein n=1 Tax=Salix dunnii TaxID=1413687 RepID=A0A835KBB8_9ROSI|nr:hypothetical protein SADUNF_Sadunf05G0038200 [Salix dunnii]
MTRVIIDATHTTRPSPPLALTTTLSKPSTKIINRKRVRRPPSSKTYMHNEHDSIGRLNRLEKLDLSHCYELESLLYYIGQLDCLEKLDLIHCSQITSLPNSIGGLKFIQITDFGHCCELADLQNDIGPLKSLRELRPYNVGQTQQISWNSV